MNTDINGRNFLLSNQNANYSASISNPCAQKGTEFNQSASFIWRAPCSCQPSVKPNGTQFTFVGSNNNSECNANIIKLFDFRSICPDAEPFSNKTQPQVTESFLVSNTEQVRSRFILSEHAKSDRGIWVKISHQNASSSCL